MGDHYKMKALGALAFLSCLILCSSLTQVWGYYDDVPCVEPPTCKTINHGLCDIMKDTCPVTCGQCTPCADKRDCTGLSPALCQLQPQLKEECKESCGLCPHYTTTTTTPTPESTTPPPTRPPTPDLNPYAYTGKWEMTPSGEIECEMEHSGLKCGSDMYDVDDIHIRSPSGDTGIFDMLNKITWASGQTWTKDCIVYIVQVSAEYHEHAETEAYSYTELHTVSEDFYHVKNDKERLSGGGASIGYDPPTYLDKHTNAMANFSFGLSAAGRHTHNDVVDVNNHTNLDLTQTTKVDTTYNPGFTQIVETIKKTVIIGDSIAHKTHTNVVDSVPLGQQEGPKELNRRAKRYIWNNYAHETQGIIRGPSEGSECTENPISVIPCIYEEKVCVPKKKKVHWPHKEEPQCLSFSYQVKAEYYQQALIEEQKYREIIKKTELMSNALTTLIDDKEGCAEVGLMGFDISANAYNDATDKNTLCSDVNTEFHEKTDKKIGYNEKMLQIVQKITTEITVDDKILITKKYNYEDAIPIDSPKTTEELEEMARNYIRLNYQTWPGDILGEIQHIYRETGCPFITIPKPKGWCEKDKDCHHDQTCVDHFCKDKCSLVHCQLPHEVCKVDWWTHKASCQCDKNWVRTDTSQCVRPEPGHCLPGQHCKAGDCCALGSSCNTCPYGKESNDHECAGKGNFQCKWERRQKSTLGGTPCVQAMNTWKDITQNVGKGICNVPSPPK